MENNSSKGIDLKSLLSNYTKQWKWFILSLFITLGIAFMIIRYSTPQYSAQAKVQILDSQSSTPELSVFQDLDVFAGSSNPVEDEIQTVKSRSNFIEIVKSLKLNVKIVLLGNLLDSEIYGVTPFNLNFIEPDSVIHNSNAQFYITINSENSLSFSDSEEGPDRAFSFGKKINTKLGGLVITPNLERIDDYIGRKFRISITPIHYVAQDYLKRINIFPAENASTIIDITLQDNIQQKAQDIINSLIFLYNQNAVEDKRTIANRTSDFINNRITDISSSLSNVDQSAEDFKTDRGLTDIASESNINLTVGATNQQELQNTNTQLNIASSMKDIVDNQQGYEVLPSNIGLSDPTIGNISAKYNELVLERKRLLKSSNEKNPIIVNLDEQLDGLKRNMQSSLSSMTNNLGLQLNNLNVRRSQINSRIYSAPGNERALRDITRKQQTTEQLYLYLLQKREESQIAFASAAPKSRVIDSAYSESSAPVSPEKSIIYSVAFLVGLFVPFVVIYAGELLDDKVHNKLDVEKLVGDVPVLAELPKLSKKENKLIYNKDRSVLAESLRILRTNLDYIIASNKKIDKKNLIFVTSSISGEGKTFLSSNLSMVLASTNKKVLLIGADIRNPKLYKFFSGVESDAINKPRRIKEVGLTEYLINDELTSKDVITPMLVHENTIDIIYSGKIPPNPAELLMSDRVGKLLDEVSKIYDYVIVDTAPLMVVTDTLLISEHASQIIYVTKAGVTENRVLEFPLKLKNEGKLNNLSFVVNNVKASDLGYGGKYGYGYSKQLKKWWKF
ncbi:Tyrosine-protein kinase CpsD [Flagellimonas maritima]|uniref:non-specific protein-tyrosine kinase n=1 Tax=Flagellimonas maritima TaxID=1383885 RepID=A0A2Z4LV70_9FLAO|nr:tyrosine-protein kinase [Allomuricauda aurantiaca]AWX45815.1 Tyrosine-protein kinase CpsD [Allomuricauda aurantiaca]